MRRVGTCTVVLAAFLWLSASGIRAGKANQSTSPGERAVASAPAAKTALYTDPYRRYFSGHYCDCWRKANQLPIDEKSMFAGVLPRADSLPWSKKKVIDMSGFGPEEKFLCRAFAGLINRRKGMWYCKEPEDFWLAGPRAPWKDAMTGSLLKGYYGHEGKIINQGIGNTVNAGTYMDGIKRWIVEFDPPSIDGCVLYDPALWDPAAKPRQPRDLLNVIRTVCGVERALPLTPSQYEDLTRRLGDPNKLPVILDTTKRDDWNIDKFHGDAKAAAYHLYAWAFNNFWKNEKNPDRQCTHHVLCYMPPVGPSSDPEQDLTDYAVQWKMFCFYSDGGGKIDEKHMEYVLGQTPMNIPVIGQLTLQTGPEGGAARARLLRLFSRFGKFYIDGAEAANLSIHSGERPKERMRHEQKPAPPVALEADKRYVAFCLSGVNSIGHYMHARASHWEFASRGSVPVGWGIPLTAADAVPNITKYYYQKASPNDCFVADLGGLGLALPTVWGAGSNQPEALLADYFQRSSEYFGYLDVSTMWAAWLDDKSLGTLAQTAKDLGGVFYGIKGAGNYLERASFMQDGLPVIHTYVDTVSDADALQKIPAALARAKERFVFIGVDEAGFEAQEDVVGAIARIAQELGDTFVVVRPDQLARLYAEAVKAGQAPAEPPKLALDADERPQLTLKRVADGAVRVDGDLEEWSRLPAMRASVLRDGRTVARAKAPAGEIVAEVAAVVDSQFLYVRAEVRDDEVIVDDVDLTAGDCVELMLDARRAPFREPLETQGFYRLALVPAAGLVKQPQLVLQYPTYDVGLVSMNRHGIREALSSVATNDGYRIEAAIPLRNFPDCGWRAGERLAIGFAVRDLDGRWTDGLGASVAAAIDPLRCRPAVVE